MTAIVLALLLAQTGSFGGSMPPSGAAVGARRTTDGRMVPLAVDGTGALITAGGAGPSGAVDQGSPALAIDAWFVKITDGIDTAAVSVAGAISTSVASTSTATASDTGTCVNVTASTTVLASNASRHVAVILNNGTATVHLKLGATATTANPPLTPGRDFTIDGNTVYTGVVDVIASTGTQSVCVFEW